MGTQVFLKSSFRIKKIRDYSTASAVADPGLSRQGINPKGGVTNPLLVLKHGKSEPISAAVENWKTAANDDRLFRLNI